MKAIAASTWLIGIWYLGWLTAAPQLLAGEHRAQVTIRAMPVQQSQMRIEIKVEPNEGFQLTTENAPWSLKLSGVQGADPGLAKTVWKGAELVSLLPQGSIDIQPKASGAFSPPESLNYELIAFVCTSDKTQCFREVYRGVVQR